MQNEALPEETLKKLRAYPVQVTSTKRQYWERRVKMIEENVLDSLNAAIPQKIYIPEYCGRISSKLRRNVLIWNKFVEDGVSPYELIVIAQYLVKDITKLAPRQNYSVTSKNID